MSNQTNEPEKKRYKHIFDYFDYEGKYIGGVEPETDEPTKPLMRHTGAYQTPAFVVYMGWVDKEQDPNGERHIMSGCVFSDGYMRNPETKEISVIYDQVVEHEFLGSYSIPKKCKKFFGSETIEDACEFVGCALPERYVEYREQKEAEFRAEYERCMNDFEYFKEKYIRYQKVFKQR